MTYEEAKEIIKNITYKPSNDRHGGWLHLHERKCSYKLLATISGPDSDSGPENLLISATLERSISKEQFASLSDFDFIRMIRNLIVEIETHEVDEFLKHKGYKVFDPHRSHPICLK